MGAAVQAAWDALAWQALWQDPQLPHALISTVSVGLIATVIATALAAWLVSAHFPGPRWLPLLRRLPAMLAVPHAAFAIGLVLIVAPSGWLLRGFSPWLTGFETPPAWSTSQDPYGLGLIAVLIFKEVPFLVWTAATHLQRPDFARTLQQSLSLASALGYPPRTAWWRVVAPQLVSKMRWPFLAVMAYSLTVVDVALVAGPTTPPTLAVLALTWLQDADPFTNSKGAAAAWLLAALLGVAAAVVACLRWPKGWHARGIANKPARSIQISTPLGGVGKGFVLGPSLAWVWPGTYVAIGVILVLASCAGPWPFPDLLPAQWSGQAWRSVLGSSSSLWTTLVLGAISSVTALIWSLAWLEWTPKPWRRAMQQLVFIPLVLPGILWTMGLHQLSVRLQLDGSMGGVVLAHTLGVLPYTVIALAPAYTQFDQRLASLSASFGKPYAVFLWKVKWPMLKTALASSLAVGFAVSVAQYLPTLFVGAGRINTVTTEAIALSSGGQRSLLAAFAVLQTLLPLLAFAWAHYVASTKNENFDTNI